MKFIAQILMIVGMLATLSGCGVDPNVIKLKKTVELLNSNCPVDIGVAGVFTSIEYNGQDMCVHMKFLNTEYASAGFIGENKENARENLKLMFQTKELQEMLTELVDAKAGIVATYKLRDSMKALSIALSYEELKEIKDHPLSELERNKLLFKNKIEMDGRRCPYEMAKGIMMEKTELTDGYIVFHISVDEEVCNFGKMKLMSDELKDNIVRRLEVMSGDINLQNELRMMSSLGIGYHYKYIGSKSGDSVDVLIPEEDLAQYCTTEYSL